MFESDRSGNWEVYLLNLNAISGTARFLKVYTAGSVNWQVFEPIGIVEVVNLTNDPSTDGQPRWLPDASMIAFASDRHGEFVIDPSTGEKRRLQSEYLMNPDGSEVALLTALEPTGTLPSWSPDGQQIAYFTPAPKQQDQQIWITDRGGMTHRLLVQGYAPAWSPDGAWIAFLRYPHGIDDRVDSELYLVRPDGSDEHLLLKNRDPIHGLVWSPDGKELAFLSFGDVYIVNTETAKISVLDLDFGGGACTGWSPDGEWLACDFRSNIYAVNLKNPWLVALVLREPGDISSNLVPNWGP